MDTTHAVDLVPRYNSRFIDTAISLLVGRWGWVRESLSSTKTAGSERIDNIYVAVDFIGIFVF